MKNSEQIQSFTSAPLDAAVSTATGGVSGFAAIPAGTYTYVSRTPAAETGSNAGQVQFIWPEKKLIWAFGAHGGVKTGAIVLSGDELEFFQGLYLSDRPLYDWLGAQPRNTEGYAGNVAGNVRVTFTEDGKISEIRLDSATTNVQAVITKGITAQSLSVYGAVRGQPHLLQSCLTLIGSANGLRVLERGNVVLDNLTLGGGVDGVGLYGEKTGGDTFIVGTVAVDGEIQWYSKGANIQPITEDSTATLLTNGQNITMTGANISRVGRKLNISTGEGKGGNIIIGAAVSSGTLLLSTSGDITAGSGDVIIGTNTENIVTVNRIGNIRGANVTIKPTDHGIASDVQMSIGNITATGNIDIEVADVNTGKGTEYVMNTSAGVITVDNSEQLSKNRAEYAVGDLMSENGYITFTSGVINGPIGKFSAPNGTVNLTVEHAGCIDPS